MFKSKWIFPGIIKKENNSSAHQRRETCVLLIVFYKVFTAFGVRKSRPLMSSSCGFDMKIFASAFLRISMMFQHARAHAHGYTFGIMMLWCVSHAADTQNCCLLWRKCRTQWIGKISDSACMSFHPCTRKTRTHARGATKWEVFYSDLQL